MPSLLRCLLLAFAFTSVTAQKNIVTIGDSHGASTIGWVYQLKQLRPADSILNFCVSGNTIGFDNNGDESLNELRQIDSQLRKTAATFDRVDCFVVMLGTNDCKAVFDSRQQEVTRNLKELLTKINTYRQPERFRVILVTPPPIARDEQMEPKYHGGAGRAANLIPYYEQVAREHELTLVDIYHTLLPDYDTLTHDGIHLTEAGYKRVAVAIDKMMR